MAQQRPYLNPRLPFTGRIQGGLFEGKAVTITGRVLPGADRFHVNLQYDAKGSSEIALHFNPRYSGNSGCVVCNSFHNSSWGSEERSSKSPVPRGATFNLTFLVNRDSYSVIVNGAHFLEYLHRLAVSCVNAISVGGGVEIESIAFQNPTTHCVPDASFPHQVLPYKTFIQGGLHPGKVIMVQGTVNHNADRFCINLRFATGLALHLNPRLNEGVVVRNSLLHDRWGPEERSGGMPFYRNQPFTVAIVCDTQCYRININGVQMFTYNHRHCLSQKIDILEVDGNLNLTSVTV
ncbi:galectin-9-like isoform X3 [Electrophorus electricus]|uniref:galectin-9-like isoform X3 n=1 Tax=Electrophorus electricus TaxID=8005 RepID=UPI0015D03BBB|nr:galectin-9-like isoform X3 [Electrophorus electricus]